MKKRIIIFILCLIPIITNSQIKLTGKIIDNASKEGISYSTIVLKNFPIGTMADINGWFNLKIPDSIPNDETIII